MGSKSRSRSSSANSDKGDSDSANRNSRIRRSTKNNLTTLFSCVLLGSSSFLTSFPPGAAAQELVTTNLFPDIPLPTVSSIPPLPVPSQPPLPPPVQPVQPVSLLPNGTSSSSSGQNQPSSSSTSTSPISVYTLVAELPSPTPSLSPVLAGTPFTFPSPLPDGIARTASGKPIPCSPKNVHLNPTTHKLISECTETAFCAQPPDAPANATGLGMCFARRCTRDEFPFGYGTFGGGIGRKKNSTTAGIPPMCPKGTFCPDNGSGCMPPIEIGGRCELARDEQCAPPPPNPNVKPQDNKSICLNNYCL
ncbi:hypothetical protein D9613_012464 [Agrocybe pediades]|uniref:Uncharacterized protein n=1 Tax=Agrocybe pediades TaxID=84607 RepID=A0A8H4QRV5_9AGAR|nr:hypothetical protein D9613_012464 [Agrocybe pediades]